MLSTDPHRDIDRQLALERRAQMLADLETSVLAGVSELRAMAGGDARLLAGAAAATLSAHVSAHPPTDSRLLLAGVLLLLAGADDDLVAPDLEAARREVADESPLRAEINRMPDLALRLRSLPSGPDIYPWLLER